MAAGKSKEDIVSIGLIYIGESPISSFSEGTAGVVASNTYDTIRDDLLSSHRWRFATGKAALSRLTATPLNEWTYAHQLPSNLLVLIRTYPDSLYEIYEDKLYNHSLSTEIDYVYRPDEGDFPAYFVNALAHKIAASFAISITNNRSLAEHMETLAQIHVSKARYLDAQSRPPTPIVSRPWVAVRRG